MPPVKVNYQFSKHALYSFMSLQMLFHLHSYNWYLLSANCGQGTIVGSRDKAGEEMRPEFYGLLIFITMASCSFTEIKFKQKIQQIQTKFNSSEKFSWPPRIELYPLTLCPTILPISVIQCLKHRSFLICKMGVIIITHLTGLLQGF